ncbi:MAG: hypothetical protein KDE14_01370 [Rhodobacteraceae bacterium]|nr:hypothetical protein [Paracoccaceae bacterium]
MTPSMRNIAARAVGLALAGSLAGFGNACAANIVLSTQGLDLGRISASESGSGLQIAVDVRGDEIGGTFVVARLQDNRPLILASDGLWDVWNGDPENLRDAGFKASDDVLTFNISSTPLSDMPFPVTFTFGYRTGAATKYGFIVVDAP